MLSRKRGYTVAFPGNQAKNKRARVILRAPIARRNRRRPNLRSGLGIETKFLDCAWNGVALAGAFDCSSGELQPSTGCTSAISVPAQGDGESNRDGRTYTIKSMWVSGAIDHSTSQDQSDVFENYGTYFALVLDTQANGATIVSENVFTSGGGTSTFSLIPQPLRNLQYSRRYKILDSKYVPAAPMYSGTDGASTMSLSTSRTSTVNLSWKGNLVVDTNGTTANVSVATTNAIHLLAFSAGGAVKTFFGKSRMRFVG